MTVYLPCDYEIMLGYLCRKNEAYCHSIDSTAYQIIVTFNLIDDFKGLYLLLIFIILGMVCGALQWDFINH